MLKDFVKLLKFSILLSIIIFIIERSIGNGWQVSPKILMLVFATHFLYAFVISYVNVFYIDYINRFLTWEKQPTKRLIFGIIGAAIVTMIAIMGLRLFVVKIIENGNFEDFLATSNRYYIFSFILSVNIIIAVHAYFFFKAFTAKKITEHKVISKTETAKFESLKNQLDPHFLFNSLNVLTSLIEENPKQAEKFTTKLSKIYRYVLQQKSQDLIEVEQELKFAKTYMDLLKIRFEDAIEFNIPNNLENESLKIVPLSLQLLLENAVKHNIISPQKKLNITISQEKNYLVITNNYNPKKNLGKSTKVGLKNIIERYALVTQSKVIITKNKEHFIVKLPLLTQKTNIMNTHFNKEEKYYQAKKQVKKIRDFYVSLVMYCIFIPFIIFIWYNYSRNTFQWFWFPIFGWGIGIFFQGVDAFNKFPIFGKDWEKRKIQEFMNDHENEHIVKF